MRRRDRLGTRRDAGVEPALGSGRAATAPAVHCPRHAGAVGLVDPDDVLGQLTDESARDRVQRAATEVTQPGVAQIQLLTRSCHADECQAALLLDLVLAMRVDAAL